MSAILHMNGCAARMSVVLVTPHRYDAIRKTMEHLQAQTVADQLEIVIVAPSAAALIVDAAAGQSHTCIKDREFCAGVGLDRLW